MLPKYYHIAKTFINNFECFEIYYIPRENNTRADPLSKLANTKKFEHLKIIIQEMLQTPPIDTEEVMAEEKEEPYWMTPYRNFLIRWVSPLNENEARHLKRKVNYYVILDGELFKKGSTTPLLKCLNNQQTDYVMRKLQERICGLHTGGRSLETKVVRADYY